MLIPNELQRVACLDRVRAEAQQAAFFHDDINDACPYPFGTLFANTFKVAFYEAKAAERAAGVAAQTGGAA